MKKLFAILMSCIMLVLPVLSMAETVPSVSLSLYIPTESSMAQEVGNPGIVDLINAVTLRFSAANAAFRSEVLLSGEQAANLDIGVGNDSIIIASNMIGNQQIAFTKDDLVNLIVTYVP